MNKYQRAINKMTIYDMSYINTYGETKTSFYKNRKKMRSCTNNKSWSEFKKFYNWMMD